ncbi:hypothetical protein ACTFIU_010554 [Dictyostelium citrinum]
MVSKILPGLLKKILGNYIEGLDTLSIPWWKGQIVLENLKFKKELFSSNELPFDLLSGVIKRVVITIPIIHFLKDPIVVNIDGVFLLFGPKDIINTFSNYRNSNNNNDKSNKKDSDGGISIDSKKNTSSTSINNNNDDFFKKPNLTKEELKKIQIQIDKEQSKESNEGYSTDSESFKFRMIKKLLKCIRIQLNNLHICYQDDSTSPGEIFSVGITMESFTFQTTDSQWVPLSKNTSVHQQQQQAFNPYGGGSQPQQQQQNSEINYENDSEHNPFMTTPNKYNNNDEGTSSSFNNSNIPTLNLNDNYMDSDAYTSATPKMSGSTTNTPSTPTKNEQQQHQQQPLGQIVDQIITYKLASIFNFSIYWDSQFGKTRMVTPEDMDVLLMHSIPRQKAKIKHKYILQPISGFLKICLTEDSIESVNKEGVFNSIANNFNVSIGLKQIDLQLMDIQYRDMLNLLSFYQDWRRVLRYHKFRPHCRVKGNARIWWHFAFRSIISDFRAKKTEMTWKEIEDSKRIRECYIKLYTEKFIKGKLGRLDQNLIDEIEKKVTYEDIVLFRTIAEKDLKVTKRKDLDQFTESSGWWLGGWLGFQHHHQNNNQDKITLTNEQLTFLERYLKVNLKALAGKPHSSVSLIFFLNVKRLSVSILDWQENHTVVPLANIDIIEVNLQMEQSYNTKLKFSAESLDIFDRCSPNTKFENIILEKTRFNSSNINPDNSGSSIGSIIIDRQISNSEFFNGVYTGGGGGSNNGGGLKKFIDISIVLNPPEDTTDYFIYFKLEPFYFINSKPFVDTMIPFFTHANQEALDRLKYSFIKKIKILQEYLINELKHLIRNQKVADIKLDIAIPGLVFPESYDREDTMVLVCNMGNLILKTQPHNSEWDSMDFSEINEQDDTDEIFVRYCNLLKDRVKWWSDNCPIKKINEPIEKQSYIKNYVQQHRQTIENLGSNGNNNTSFSEDDGKYPEPDDIDDSKVEKEGFDSGDTDWNKVSVNINNAQFYDGIVLTISDIYVKVCDCTQINNFNYLISPFSLDIFLELCSRPYDLKLPQIKCKAELSELNLQVSDKELYEIAKIVGKNGILEYFMDMDRKSSKELADMYEVVQVKKPKKKSFEVQFSLFSDTKSILNSRKRTKERLIKTTLLRFFFTSNAINMKLNYLDSCTLSLTMDQIRCRSLVKFMQMNIQFDISSIEIKDSNSITPVLSIFPYHVNNNKNNNNNSNNNNNNNNNLKNKNNSNNNNNNNNNQKPECLNEFPITITAKSISKNSLDYDYIDFVLTLTTQYIRINFPKECVMALIAIIGTVVTNTTNFYETKKSILTVEGSFYQGRVGQFTQSANSGSVTTSPHYHHHHHQHKKQNRHRLSTRLETNEFDPNDLKSKITINIPSFGLTLSTIENDLVAFQFEDISIDGIFQLPLIDCELKVRDMKFIDYTGSDGPYPYMLITQKSQSPMVPVVRMHLVCHSNSKTQEWGFSRLINIAVGKIQITFLFQTINLIRLFIYDITSSLKEYCPFLFKVMAIVDENGKPSSKEKDKDSNSNSDSDSDSDNSEEPNNNNNDLNSPVVEIVKKKKNLTNLEIEIDNNVVILPKNSRSRSAIRFSVGRILLGLDQMDPTVDAVFVKIYGINMASKYEDSIDPIISDPIKMDIRFIHMFETSLKDKSIEVIIKIDRIHLKLSQYQYNLLYNTYQQNINQSVVPAPPSNSYTVERQDILLDIRLEFKDFVELNLEDEKTNDSRFFSMLIQRPIICSSVWNNGDSDFLVKTTGISVRDKNKLVVVPNGFQEMINITPYDLDVPIKNIINQSINEVFFDIVKMNIDDNGTDIKITIEYLSIFFDLPWVSKLITFLSPIMDADYIGSSCTSTTKSSSNTFNTHLLPPPPPPPPISLNKSGVNLTNQQKQQNGELDSKFNKDWKIFLKVEVSAKNANIMVGDLNSKNELVLLMNSSLLINSQFGTEGLMKIILEYQCIKGLIGNKAKDPIYSTTNASATTMSFLSGSSRDFGAQKNTTHYLWKELKKSSKLFLETFKTNIQVCLVPEGNQFYFCELNDLSLVFSGKAYKYLLDIYECVSDIIYGVSKSKDITNNNLVQKHSRSSSISADLPIPINLRRSSVISSNLMQQQQKQHNSNQNASSSSDNDNNNNNNNNTAYNKSVPNVHDKTKNQFYQIKTRSVEMLRAHQTRVTEKYQASLPSNGRIPEMDEENENGDHTFTSSDDEDEDIGEGFSLDHSTSSAPTSRSNYNNLNEPMIDLKSSKKQDDSNMVTKIQFSQISISIKNLNIIIMDDLSKHKMNTPIFNMKLNYGFMKAVLKTTRIEVEFDSVFQMNYFNNRIAYWEPFIEPWLFKSMMTLGKELSIDIYSTDLLNINFTIPLMDNISLFLRTYSKEFGYPFNLICAPADNNNDNGSNNGKKSHSNRHSLIGQIKKIKEKKTKTSYSPFFIRNRTGSRLRYRLETQDGKPVAGVNHQIEGSVRVVNIENYGLFFELDSGDCSPIKFLPDVQINLETFSQLVLAVELLGVEKSISIPLDKIKIYDYQVYLDSSTQTKLYANIGIKNGTKLITIQFPIVLKNVTSFPIDIATVTSGFGDTQMPNYSTTIRVGQARAPLPINRMRNVQIKFKPSGDQYKWSTEALDVNNVIEGEDKFSCILKNGEKIYYIKGFIFKKNECFIIKLCHMLKVKNLLPYPIQFKLKSPIENIPLLKRETQAIVQDQEKTEVYEIPLLDKFKIQVRIADKDGTFEKSEWSEIRSIVEREDNNEIGVITISDSNNLIVDYLHLNVEFESYKGEKKIVFYNQYWIFNKSGLNLFCKKSYHSKDYSESQTHFNHPLQFDSNSTTTTIKPSDAIVVQPDQWYSHQLVKESPLLFSFKKLKDMENSLRIRVGDSKWSHKISIAAIGDRGTIVIDSSEKRHSRSYHLGLSVDLAPNLKTKIVVFTPRFVFHNLFPYTVLVQQCGANTDSTTIRVPPTCSVPFYYFINNTGESSKPTLKFKIDYPEFEWSAPFSIQTFSDFTFNVFNGSSSNSNNNENDKQPDIHCNPYIRIKTCLEVATILVMISELREPPYRILNNTKYQLSIQQKKVGKVLTVEPSSSIPYVWDLPLEDHDLEVLVHVSPNQSEKASYKMDKIKTFKPMEFNDDHNPVVIKAIVEADESTRVLTLSDKISFQVSKYEEENLRQSFRIHFTGIGISVINANPTELLYVSIHDILCEYFISSFLQKLEMKITNIQVDNQLSKVTPYSHPVLLFADNLLPNTPFLQVRIMQELNIKVEEKFLYVLLDFFNSLDFSFWTGNKKTKNTLHNMDMLTPMYNEDIGEGFIDEMVARALPSIYGKKMYFESLDIEPISMFLTFDLSNKSGSIASLEQAPMVKAFRRIGFVIVSFQHAHIFLHGFSLSHAFGSNEELLAPIFNHYFSEGLSEVYKILGAFNLFGNPVGLVTNFGIGFKEFFVSMGKGLVGNSFTDSFGQGSKSLAKHSVYGIFDSGAKLTGSAGKVLSTLSMDQRYILERQYIIGESPNTFMQGLILGGRAAKTAVYRGFSGFVRLPYEGGKEAGPKGVVKGIGKGTAGLVLKPIAAGFDFASKVSEGIKNSTQLSIDRKRIRFPRPLFSDSPLETYDSAESYGHFLFLTYIITAGKLRRISADQINLPLMEVVSKDEKYVSHLIYKNRKTILFTNKRIIYLYDTDGFRTKFDIKYTRIHGVSEKSDHIDIKIDKKHKLSFLYNEKNKKIDYRIKCTGEEKSYIFHRIIEMIKTYKPFAEEELTINGLKADPTTMIPVPPPPPPHPQLQQPLLYNSTINQQPPIQFFNGSNQTGGRTIQPIIFTNDAGPMRNDLNPILENLLAQQPNKNMEIPIWISQGFNPPKPPDTLIPQRFRDPNLINQNNYNNHYYSNGSGYVYSQPPLYDQYGNPIPPPPPLPSQPLAIERPTTTTTTTTTNTPYQSSQNIHTTPYPTETPQSVVLKEDISKAIQTPSSGSVKKLKTPHHYNVRFEPSSSLGPQDFDIHTIRLQNQQYQQSGAPPPPPPIPTITSTTNSSTIPPPSNANQRQPLQHQFSSNSIIETPRYKSMARQHQLQQPPPPPPPLPSNRLSLTPSGGNFNHSDKFEMALNTIIQIQKIQSQQMSSLQKNQRDLQKLLFQQQSTEFDTLRNQQEQIQNIISQYHPLSPSKASLVSKLSNEPESTTNNNVVVSPPTGGASN